MKKTLLLSVVASTMIMAGGDITPVEPVVETPAVASGWEFSGQAVVYYQSHDSNVTDVFDQESSQATAGIELRATNSDVFAGIGAGVAVNGVSTLNLENGVVSGVMQGAGNAAALGTGNDIDDVTDGGWISEAYLTYGFGNTSLKAGRQTLPASLSPFAHSENWNVFKNTYDAVLAVNTDLADTALVYAFVYGANGNGYGANMSDFNAINDNDGVHMLTVQNKSIEGVTLTGTWYTASDFMGDDLNILWGDAKFAVAGVNVALQGGQITHDAMANEPTAFGAQAGYDFGMINASVAYSTVDETSGVAGYEGVFNIGGQQTPLYTQMIINEEAIASDNDTWVLRANMDALGGKIAAAYGMTSDNSVAALDYNEFDLTYTTNVFENVNVTAAYVNMDSDAEPDTENLVRFVARYNF